METDIYVLTTTRTTTKTSIITKPYTVTSTILQVVSRETTVMDNIVSTLVSSIPKTVTSVYTSEIVSTIVNTDLEISKDTQYETITSTDISTSAYTSTATVTYQIPTSTITSVDLLTLTTKFRFKGVTVYTTTITTHFETTGRTTITSLSYVYSDIKTVTTDVTHTTVEYGESTSYEYTSFSVDSNGATNTIFGGNKDIINVTKTITSLEHTTYTEKSTVLTSTSRRTTQRPYNHPTTILSETRSYETADIVYMLKTWSTTRIPMYSISLSQSKVATFANLTTMNTMTSTKIRTLSNYVTRTSTRKDIATNTKIMTDMETITSTSSYTIPKVTTVEETISEETEEETFTIFTTEYKETIVEAISTKTSTSPSSSNSDDAQNQSSKQEETTTSISTEDNQYQSSNTKTATGMSTTLPDDSRSSTDDISRITTTYTTSIEIIDTGYNEIYTTLTEDVVSTETKTVNHKITATVTEKVPEVFKTEYTTTDYEMFTTFSTGISTRTVVNDNNSTNLITETFTKPITEQFESVHLVQITSTSFIEQEKTTVSESLETLTTEVSTFVIKTVVTSTPITKTRISSKLTTSTITIGKSKSDGFVSSGSLTYTIGDLHSTIPEFHLSDSESNTVESATIETPVSSNEISSVYSITSDVIESSMDMPSTSETVDIFTTSATSGEQKESSTTNDDISKSEGWGTSQTDGEPSRTTLESRSDSDTSSQFKPSESTQSVVETSDGTIEGTRTSRETDSGSIATSNISSESKSVDTITAGASSSQDNTFDSSTSNNKPSETEATVSGTGDITFTESTLIESSTGNSRPFETESIEHITSVTQSTESKIIQSSTSNERSTETDLTESGSDIASSTKDTMTKSSSNDHDPSGSNSSKTNVSSETVLESIKTTENTSLNSTSTWNEGSIAKPSEEHTTNSVTHVTSLPNATPPNMYPTTTESLHETSSQISMTSIASVTTTSVEDEDDEDSESSTIISADNSKKPNISLIYSVSDSSSFDETITIVSSSTTISENTLKTSTSITGETDLQTVSSKFHSSKTVSNTIESNVVSSETVLEINSNDGNSNSLESNTFKSSILPSTESSNNILTYTNFDTTSSKTGTTQDKSSDSFTNPTSKESKSNSIPTGVTASDNVDYQSTPSDARSSSGSLTFGASRDTAISSYSKTETTDAGFIPNENTSLFSVDHIETTRSTPAIEVSNAHSAETSDFGNTEPITKSTSIHPSTMTTSVRSESFVSTISRSLPSGNQDSLRSSFTQQHQFNEISETGRKTSSNVDKNSAETNVMSSDSQVGKTTHQSYEQSISSSNDVGTQLLNQAISRTTIPTDIEAPTSTIEMESYLEQISSRTSNPTFIHEDLVTDPSADTTSMTSTRNYHSETSTNSNIPSVSNLQYQNSANKIVSNSVLLLIASILLTIII